MPEDLLKIVQAVQLKVNYEVHNAETGSIYLHKANKVVRLADHVSFRDEFCIQVCYYTNSNGFVVVINKQVYHYKSYKQVVNLLINYYYFADSFEELKTLRRIINEQKVMIDGLNKELKDIRQIKSDYDILKDKSNKWKSKMTQLESGAASYKKQISELIDKNKELENDCKEAADLLKLVLDSDNRELLKSKEGKRYYLDNFPSDVQVVLKDIIKEYYNK